MAVPRLRLFLLTTALALAAALSVSALLWAAAPTVSASAAEKIPAVQSDSEESPAAEPMYVLRAVDGELCIFQNRSLLHRTGVYTASLPREDRELLEGGIAAASEEALASLLEDLCS